MPSIGRRLQDVAQKARGRYALKYELEIIPYFVGELPTNVQRVLFAWERGTKLFVTDAEKVNPNTRAVFFKQYLRQQATIYYEGNEVVPKEFSFKIQSVTTDSKGHDERKTIGKVKVDLAQFCDGQSDPQPQDIFLQCKPHGKLKVSVKAIWLKDQEVDADAMTEITQATSVTEQVPKSRKGKKANRDGNQETIDEQDLSGFDHGGEASGSHQEQQGDEEGEGGRRNRRKGRRRKQLEEEIPEGFEAPVDPNEQGEGDEGGTGMPRLVIQGPVGAGSQIHKSSWRDYVCCCCGQQLQQVDPHEAVNLLNDKQQAALDMQNNHEPVEQRKKRKKKKRVLHDDDVASGGGPQYEDDGIEQEMGQAPWMATSRKAGT